MAGSQHNILLFHGGDLKGDNHSFYLCLGDELSGDAEEGKQSRHK